MSTPEPRARKKTFASYLAEAYQAKEGFVPATLPEVQDLVAASDIVLTRSNGLSFHILCIVDREANPAKRFALSSTAVGAIGSRCLEYSGTVNRTKMPVVVQIMEIGGGRVTESDRSRLKEFKRSSVYSQVVISAWRVDVMNEQVWSNAAFNGYWSGGAFIARLLRGPRVSIKAMQRSNPVLPAPAPPYVTYALFILLLVVFLAECVYRLGDSRSFSSPSVMTLIVMGGLNRTLAAAPGEWFRIFSAPLLHADAMHVVCNGIALVIAGAVLENLVGRLWYAALFFAGATCGAVASLAFNPPEVVSVGASGGIVALLCAAFISSMRLPFGAERARAQFAVARMLIPALIPLVLPSGVKVDFAAHVGGALSGAMLGGFLLATWSPESPRPRFAGVAAVLTVAGICAAIFASISVMREYRIVELAGLRRPARYWAQHATSASQPSLRSASQAEPPPPPPPPAPLPGDEGLDQLLREGRIRRANEQDVVAWRAAVHGGYEVPFRWDPESGRRFIFRTYVIQREMTFPAGLYGAHQAIFIVPNDVPRPFGDPGQSRVLAMP